MDIVIKNCNNIDEARIAIQPARLNVKYGPNGVGKSTIAKAIALNAEGGGANLTELQPFKYRGENSADKQPQVQGADNFKSVATFNESYISQFVFQPDELVKNSFDIFVRNADYDAKMREIEEMVGDIQQIFRKNEDIDRVVSDLQALSDSFGKSQSGYAKSGRIARGLAKGNKLEHVPEKLAGYGDFIKSPINIQWIKWQLQGKEFLGLSNNCPYCTAPTAEKKDIILAVAEEYDAKAIEHLVALQGIVSRLGSYFSVETLKKLDEILRHHQAPSAEAINYLKEIKAQTDTLRGKLSSAKSISFFSLREIEKVQEAQQILADAKIDLSLLAHVNAEPTRKIVDEVNKCLDTVLAKAGQLQGEVNRQKHAIEKTIGKYRAEINTFLRNAGYRYVVDIRLEGVTYKMKLKHEDFANYIENGAAHLSYGEKNAFALVLFMYDCLTKNPDLIVLDDPISSFDKTKKFAILTTLFRGKDTFQGRTVLMLTHDIEPVIDLVKTVGASFQPMPVASFLTSDGGQIAEMAVTKADIVSFSQICSENLQAVAEPVIQLVYLRRNYEIANDKGNEYNLLSSLLHKRDVPTKVDGAAMSAAEVDKAIGRIKEALPAFDYLKLLARVKDEQQMRAVYKATRNRYEKLQLFRIVAPEVPENDLVKKYINETYHVENEYIMQLNPRRFDSVPEHITRQCDGLLKV
jgi:energy-coupling factor transporter ATP-binding protein EcfA2